MTIQAINRPVARNNGLQSLELSFASQRFCFLMKPLLLWILKARKLFRMHSTRHEMDALLY